MLGLATEGLEVAGMGYQQYVLANAQLTYLYVAPS